jgi:hypothetical protein
MGNTGYLGTDDRVTNYDFSDRVKGHSGVFKEQNIAWFGDFIKRRLGNES